MGVRLTRKIREVVDGIEPETYFTARDVANKCPEIGPTIKEVCAVLKTMNDVEHIGYLPRSGNTYCWIRHEQP